MPAPPSCPDFTACPDWGKGGRYVYDPATGLRTRGEDAPALTETTKPTEPPENITLPAPFPKEKKHA